MLLMVSAADTGRSQTVDRARAHSGGRFRVGLTRLRPSQPLLPLVCARLIGDGAEFGRFVDIMAFLIGLLGTAASVWIAVWLIDGFEFGGEWWQFLIVAIVVGLANAIVKPILRLLSLPLIALTLGLFLVVVNALVLQLAVWVSGPDVLDLGLTSEGFFWTTLLASIVVSVAGWLLGILLPDDGRIARNT